MRAPLLVSWLLAVTQAQLYEYGIVNPSHSVVDVFDVPQSRGSSHCYDNQGQPQQCIPPFVNAAFNREVGATNTCGIPPIQYCRQTGVTGARKECDICDARDPRKSHPARFLTDFAREDANDTWWQSETMLQNVQYPNGVNLTLNLRKAFDITYVRLRFHTSVPESFAIYKQKCETCPWTPLQYYSASCRMTYGVENRDVIRADDEQKALCTNEFSDISPLTGGNIPFSTLEGRPSRDNFDNSPVLQDWVTATGIRIALNRLNTFGDEVFGDPKVLKSYFYAISDFAVGGRCKCNGHASECVNSTGLNLEPRLVCRCEHNTTGPDCSECLPFYQDHPWAKATLENAHACRMCNCNGLSNRCYFDEELFRRTGSGGHCLDCQRNTAGPHCERCKEEHYRNPETNECTPCYCNQMGATNLQCDELGRCSCKQGVGGDKCDRCQPNFYDFSNYGCRPCACDAAGSLNNNPSCEVNTGVCRCKENVEGQNCDRCKPGFFNLDLENEFGCMACFCFGQSSQCVSSKQFSAHLISSDFQRSSDNWLATDEPGSIRLPLDWPPSLTAQSTDRVSSVYFSAPVKFLGNQKFSYNQLIKFKLKVANEGAIATRNDIVLEGSGYKISAPIFAQGNKLPTSTFQIYAFRLHEHPNFQWTPRLQTSQFQKLLANLTALRIRATYSAGDMGHLDDPELESAKRGLPISGLGGAPWVEECTCPPGYVGQFCESCAPGFRREPPNGGPFSRCVPCNCNGHSHTCDVNTGRCICQHNTVGKNCERCASGFYGYALRGRHDDCRPCPCPKGGLCMENPDGEVICTSCPDGYTGSRCGSCADGFFGDLRACDVRQIGEGRCKCSPCQCSGNYDRNAVGNCDRITGECLKCIYNTAGFYCERCAQGYYGNALDDLVAPNSKCKRCNCYRGGTVNTNTVGELQCQQTTGQCPCLPHVIGRQCEECETSYWNLDSGRGCELCGCDPTGSFNGSCNLLTGQCACKQGVTARTCNKCAPGFYGFSSSGCRACECSPIGSTSIQCNDFGQCPCRDNVIGRRCDRCAENMFGLRESRGGTCRECPPCYGLIQQRVDQHRLTMERFKTLLAEGSQSLQITDEDFERALNDVTATINELLGDAEGISGDQGAFARYRDFLKELEVVKSSVDNVLRASRQLDRQKNVVVSNAEEAKEAVDRIEDLLRRLREMIRTGGQAALDEAKAAQTEFGKQAKEMGEMRDEARHLAAQHVEVVADIGDVAQEAFNTSRDAHDMAIEALTRGEDIASDLNRLSRNFGDFDDDLRRLKKGADRIYEETKACKKNAKSIIDSLKTDVPKSSLKRVKEQSSDAIKRATSLVKVADRLKQQHADVIRQVYQSIADAQKLLDDTRLQQQELDDLLARADVAYNVAKEAKEKAEAILLEGQQTLKILKNFDNEVNESKEKAERALAKQSRIQKLIRDAEAKTRDANEGLVDAGKDSETSLDNARQSIDTAREAGEEAGKIVDDVRQTSAESARTRAKAETLAAVVDDTDYRLRELEEAARADVQKAVDAETMAAATGDSSRQSIVKAATLLRDLEKILLDLANLSMTDPAEVERLKRDLEAGEKALQDIHLDKEQSRLEIGARQQEQWINDYVRTIDDLEKDVINVENIRKSLPDKCYNYISIEQGNVGGLT